MKVNKIYYILEFVGSVFILLSPLIQYYLFSHYNVDVRNKLDINATNFYPYFSLIMLFSWLRTRNKTHDLNYIKDQGMLIATAVYIIIPFLTLGFLYILKADPRQTFSDLVYFGFTFTVVGLSFAVATNHTARLSSSLSNKRIFVYSLLVLLLIFIPSFNVSLISNMTFNSKLMILIIIYAVTYLPYKRNNQV